MPLFREIDNLALIVLGLMALVSPPAVQVVNLVLVATYIYMYVPTRMRGTREPLS